MCIKESNCPDGYYLDEEDDTYKKCYDTCKKCSKGGDSNSHNCAKCADGYYFIYNKVGYCIKKGEQPNNTYLDDDTYRECWSTCGTCEKGGSQTSNNCKTCYVYINGTYAYHFIYTQEGQCVGDDQKCTNCYLDEDDNTYKKCYDTCGTCNKAGDSTNPNCLTCPPGYHFIYNRPGVCIKESEKCTSCYLDEDDDTYKECNSKCKTCSKAGTSDSPNCDSCPTGYHFIYNQTGLCIPESEKPEDTYLDNDTDTYKKCYETCASCSKGGSLTEHNCNECAKDNNGNYLYHFIYTKEGNCVSENEKCAGCHLHEENNTYILCYESCGTCTELGDATNHKCIKCAPGYSFTYEAEGNCVNVKPNNSYYDEDENKYKKCYDTCSKCYGEGSEDDNRCSKCAPGYHFVYNKTGLCISTKPDDCYYDEEDDTFKKCYSTCGTCEKGGDASAHNCKTCYVYINGTYAYHFIYTQEGQCVGDDQKCTNCYLDEDDNTYKKCYDTCGTCNKAGDSTNPNCLTCPPGYHFIYNRPGVCIKESEKCTSCYLDEDDDTYKECYERCETCTRPGTSANHNCEMCKQNSDGTFIYHFIYGKEGQCISESEKPENYYIDDDNTYKPCHERCATCNGAGDDDHTNCIECAKSGSSYLYHFIYTVDGQCISESEKPNNTYLDEDDNTYKKCYDTCGSCETLGDSTDHKCTSCIANYHFIYTSPGQCYPEDKKCDRCYLDEGDNTYKKCYEACSACSKGGSFDDHNCDACAKASNGSYILHFMFNDTGNCYDDCDMPDGLYLDESDNTFKKCYSRCQNCEFPGDDTTHNCTQCLKDDAGNYLYAFVFNVTGQCVDFGTAPAGTTYNNRTNTYEKCHKRCGSCYGEGKDGENMCTLCAYTLNGTTGEYTFLAHFYSQEIDKANCYYANEQPAGTYLKEDNNTYTNCYPRCGSCSQGGNETNHNCDTCKLDDENKTYLYWVVDNPGQCITSGEAPANMYLNTENNTYLYCYERCGSCTELGDENDHKCTSCAKDIITGEYLYHFTEDNQTNCIPDSEKPANTYLDPEDNTYKKCYERCESCSAKGDASAMNCDKCKSNSDGSVLYYLIDNKPGQCVTKEDAPSNTYFDESKQVFVSCYHTCASCTVTGTAEENNCTSCLQDKTFEYYPLEGRTGQCVNLTIIGDNYYLEDGTYRACYERCGACTKGGDAENNNCDECAKDGDGRYLYHFVHNKAGQCISESEKPENVFLNETDNTYTTCPDGWSYNADAGTCYQLLSLDDLTTKLGSSDFVLKLVNKTYTNPTDNYTFLVTTNTSDIDSYVSTIKSLYKIDESTNLLVGVVNTLNEDGTASRVVSKVFTEDGAELDILEMQDDLITVNLEFKGTETLTPEMAKYIHDYDNEYDVFDAKNKFYTDKCAGFQDQNGKDVILEDRQKYYYTNYCGICKYIGTNYETNKVSCQCSVNGNQLNETVEFPSSFSVNLGVVKCTSEAFKGRNIKNNASFFVIICAVLGQIGLIVSFFMFGYPQLLNRVKNVANPVKNATENKDKNKITFKVGDLKNPEQEENTHNVKPSESSMNNLSNSQAHFASSSISNMNKLEKPVEQSESPINVYKFAYIVQNTEKTYLAMYWEMFKEEYILCRCIFRKSIFETYAFNFSYYIMYLTFVLGFNALFLYGNIMHLIFLGKLTTFQYLLSPILACIATQIVLYFPKMSIFDYPLFYSVYKNQKKEGEVQNTINALVEKVKSKSILFFVIMTLVTLFNVFYLTCFCSIFNGSQGKLFADFIISLFLYFVVNCGVSALIAGLRYYGFHNNNERVLKIQKTLKDFFIAF